MDLVLKTPQNGTIKVQTHKQATSKWLEVANQQEKYRVCIQHLKTSKSNKKKETSRTDAFGV